VTKNYLVCLAELTIGYSVAGTSQLLAVIENQKIFKGQMTRDYLVRLAELTIKYSVAGGSQLPAIRKYLKGQ
jgi:hypothetical protein